VPRLFDHEFGAPAKPDHSPEPSPLVQSVSDVVLARLHGRDLGQHGGHYRTRFVGIVADMTGANSQRSDSNTTKYIGER